MIRLRRGAKPAILVEKEEEWTHEYCDHTGPRSEMSTTVRYRYRAREVKDAVRRDSHGKCVYCESFVTQVHPGEIEHIVPSSKRPDLVVAWENLGFVCTECNREKSDYHEPELPLVNPFEDDPADHLAFYGPLVLQRPGAARGEMTVRQLKLNDRAALLERRRERVEQLQVLLDRIEGVPEGPLREALDAVVGDELADGKPYAAVAREFVRQARA